jgi:hypothetical protein
MIVPLANKWELRTASTCVSHRTSHDARSVRPFLYHAAFINAC